MRQETLKDILLEQINATQGYISKGSLYLYGEQEQYSPESVGRCLRNLEKKGEIQVDYYTGKRKQKLARYARLGESKPVPQKPKIEIININGQFVAQLQ